MKEAPRDRHQVLQPTIYLYPGGHAPVRSYTSTLSPFACDVETLRMHPDAESDLHSGPGLTPREVLATEADSCEFDEHPSAEGLGRIDRVVWEGEHVVGLLLNFLKRPEWFGGECLALAIEFDRDTLRVERVEPEAAS